MQLQADRARPRHHAGAGRPRTAPGLRADRRRFRGRVRDDPPGLGSQASLTVGPRTTSVIPVSATSAAQGRGTAGEGTPVELRQLAYFLKAVELKSISKAAERSH